MNEDIVQKEYEGNPERATAPYSERSSAPMVCPVVGIGASAGGLEAFTRLLEHLPATTGMAYVFVQHLDPTHPSLLPGLLARVTTMAVREVTDGMRVEPNQVYVLPPMPLSRLNRTPSRSVRCFLSAVSASPLITSCAPWRAHADRKRLACSFLEPPPMAREVSRPSRPREVSPLRKTPTPQPSHKCPRVPLPPALSITFSHPKRSPGNSVGSVSNLSSRRPKRRSPPLHTPHLSYPQIQMRNSLSEACCVCSGAGRESIFSPTSQLHSSDGFGTGWQHCGW